MGLDIVCCLAMAALVAPIVAAIAEADAHDEMKEEA